MHESWILTWVLTKKHTETINLCFLAKTYVFGQIISCSNMGTRPTNWVYVLPFLSQFLGWTIVLINNQNSPAPSCQLKLIKMIFWFKDLDLLKDQLFLKLCLKNCFLVFCSKSKPAVHTLYKLKHKTLDMPKRLYVSLSKLVKIRCITKSEKHQKH